MKTRIFQGCAILALALGLTACGGDAATTPTAASAAQPTTVTSSAPTTANSTAAATPSPAAGMNGNGMMGDGGQGTAPTTIPMPTAALDPNLKTTLTVWSDLDSSLAGTLNTQIQRYKKLYPNVTVSIYTLDSGELNTRLLALKNGGTDPKLLPPPDLIFSAADYTGAWADAGAIQPVSALLDSGYLKAFDPNALSGANYKGQLWGAPLAYSHTLALYYNKGIVPNVPATTDDMIAQAKTIRDGRQNGGLVFDANEPFNLMPWLNGYGGAVVDANGQPTLDTPAMVNSLTFVQNLTSTQHLVPMATPRNTIITFVDGKIGMYVSGDWSLTQIQTREMQMEKQAANKPKDAQGDDIQPYTPPNTSIAPLPKVSATGQPAAPFFDNPTVFLGSHLQANTDALKAAKLLLGYFADTQQQTEIATNVELVPATTAAITGPTVQQNVYLAGLAAQLVVAKPQPVGAQMPAIWAAIRPSLAQVVAGTMTPADAAKAMQAAAVAALQPAK